VWVRPSLLFGRSTGTAIQSTLGGARLDVCARIEGNYSRGGGIQLDLCGGVEGAYASLQHGDQAGEPASDSGQPYLALGPSVDLRAELGRLAITIRTVAGFDVTQESFLDVTGAKVYAPILPLRVELALSWDLHGQDAPAPPPVEDIAGR
jgi:hypothetical protein